MQKSWIFKDYYDKSINVVETGIASIQPSSSTNVFKWTIDNYVTIDVSSEGPMIITFSEVVLISNYRILSRHGLRYFNGWNFSVSKDGNQFNVIDSKNEQFCDKKDGYECGETTDKIFPIRTVRARKIKIEPTVPDSRNSYSIHICAFDVYGTTKMNNFDHSCKRMNERHLSLYLLIILVST